MRKLLVLLFILCLLVCMLTAVVGTAFASAPAGEFAPVDRNATTPTPISTKKQTPTQCVMVGISDCYPTGNPINYSFAPGTTVKIRGERWAASASITLYLLSTSATGQVNTGNDPFCPAPPALATSSIAHSAQASVNASGSFSAQLALPATLKAGTPYNLCISVTNSGHARSRLLFQISINTNSQQQTGGVPTTNNVTSTTGSTAPSSYNLSLIALVLALVALLLFFITPRQPTALQLNEKRRKAS